MDTAVLIADASQKAVCTTANHAGRNGESNLSGKQSRLGINEYTNRGDKRKRRKECFIRTKSGDYEKLETPKQHTKQHHVEFRISPQAEQIGKQVASLFKLSLNQYAKAVLYRDIGFLYEPERKGGKT